MSASASSTCRRMGSEAVEAITDLRRGDSVNAGQGEKRLDVVAMELALRRLFQEMARRFSGCQRGPVRPMRGQRIEDVADADDLRQQRDFVAAKPLRIAAAIETLMMAPDDRPHAAQRLQRRA